MAAALRTLTAQPSRPQPNGPHSASLCELGGCRPPPISHPIHAPCLSFGCDRCSVFPSERPPSASCESAHARRYIRYPLSAPAARHPPHISVRHRHRPSGPRPSSRPRRQSAIFQQLSHMCGQFSCITLTANILCKLKNQKTTPRAETGLVRLDAKRARSMEGKARWGKVWGRPEVEQLCALGAGGRD